MTGTLICWDGRRVVLPDLTSWRMEYACGIPCDSFYLECLWEPGEAGALVEVNWKRDVCRGLWRVTESVCGMDARGAYTRLTLADAAAVV